MSENPDALTPERRWGSFMRGVSQFGVIVALVLLIKTVAQMTAM